MEVRKRIRVDTKRDRRKTRQKRNEWAIVSNLDGVTLGRNNRSNRKRRS